MLAKQGREQGTVLMQFSDTLYRCKYITEDNDSIGEKILQEGN
jgi:hypothetical protein